jgi:transmembrane sensor
MQTVTSQLEYLQAQRASAWIEALPDAGPKQRSEFVAWLKESPLHVREVLLALAVDRALERLDAGRVRDIESLLAQVNRQVVGFPQQPVQAVSLRPKARALRWGALAAGVIGAALCAWLYMTPYRADWKEYGTAKSEQRAFELEDGSVIYLNIDSRVAVRLSKPSREVRLLEGEALFRVRHDGSRPFRVYTKDAVIQDVGTEFNVYNRADGTVIAVIEGSVEVTPENGTAWPDASGASTATGGTPPTRTVCANEEVQITHGVALSVHRLADVSDAVAWQQRRLVFRQSTLQHIIEEFNRYSRQKIRLEGAGAMNQVYTGVFDADDPESLVQVLAREGDLIVERSEDGFVVRSR